MEKQFREIIENAKQAVANAANWIEAHNAAYGEESELGKYLSAMSVEQRREVLAGPEIAELEAIIKGKEMPPAEKSGRILLRIPRSLHASLLREAEAEGVSLNQLCATKLASTVGGRW